MSTSKKTIIGLLILGCSVGCYLLLLQLSAKPEPMYKGVPIRYWTRQTRHATEDDSVRALVEMGALAVPCLTNQLALRDGPVQKVWFWMWPKLPAFVQSRFTAPVKASDLRAGASWTLIYLGPAAKSAVPSLISALKDDNVFVRLNAAASFGKIGPDAAPAIPALIEALGDKHRGVSFNAAYSLSLLGPLAKDTVPALKGALNDSDPDVRQRAREALQAIDPKAFPSAR